MLKKCHPIIAHEYELQMHFAENNFEDQAIKNYDARERCIIVCAGIQLQLVFVHFGLLC